MKDSGIEWIGEIPDNWEIKNIKSVLKERKESNNPIKTDFILSLTNDRGVIPYSEKGDIGNKSKEDITGYKLAYPNDIVLNSMNVVIGSVGLSKYYGAVSPVYYMLYARDNDNIEFFNYIFQTKEFQHNLKGYGNGIMEIRMRIPMIKLNTVGIPYPTPLEQRRIVEYLDIQLHTINNVIKKQTQLIEEYKNYKQSLITETVTKGLNPNVEMKDSGIAWADKVPENWKVDRLKKMFSFGKGLSITKENLVESGIGVISYGQIHSKENTGVEVKDCLIRYVDESYLQTNSSCLVKKDDFIFADTSEDLDGCGNCVYVDIDETHNLFAGYHTIILSSLTHTNNKYYAYLFKTDAWRSQIRARVYGIKLFSITQKILKELTVIKPPIEEQKEIANYLDKKCSLIDNIIEQKQRLIEELEAYKKSLIYGCVTGKREIPDTYDQSVDELVQVALDEVAAIEQ